MTRFFALVCLLALAACTPKIEAMQSSAPLPAAMVQTLVLDAPWRGGLPITIVTPSDASGPLPVVLFSTGALSSPGKYMALLVPWAEAGYAVLAPLHVDSEAWTGPRPENQRNQLNWRVQDMSEVMRNLPVIERETGLALTTERLAVTGHSFGGLIAQILAGARAADVGPLDGVDVDAIVAISPPGPIPDYIEADGWSRMTVPQLLTTGTADILPMIAPDWSAHLGGHEAHPGPSWALVSEGVDHYFGNVIGRTEYPGPPQQAQFDDAAAATVRFLDAFVKQDAAAMEEFTGASTMQADRPGLFRK